MVEARKMPTQTAHLYMDTSQNLPSPDNSREHSCEAKTCIRFDQGKNGSPSKSGKNIGGMAHPFWACRAIAGVSKGVGGGRDGRAAAVVAGVRGAVPRRGGLRPLAAREA